MGTIPSYDEAAEPLGDTDQFYLEQGSGAARGKRATLQMLENKWMPPPAMLSLSGNHLSNYLANEDLLAIASYVDGTRSYMLVDPLPGGRGWRVQVHLYMDTATRFDGAAALIRFTRAAAGWVGGVVPAWASAFFAAMEAKDIPGLWGNATVRTALSPAASSARAGTVYASTLDPSYWTIAISPDWDDILGSGEAPIDIEAVIYA